MKAIVKTKDSIKLLNLSIPTLADENSVLIKVNLAGLCRTDMFAAQNKISVDEGLILGHECTGTIEQKGVQVTHLQIGQRVSVMPIFEDCTMLGVEHNGAFAEYLTLPATKVYPIPDTLSQEEAAFIEPIAACLAVCHTDIKSYQRGLIYGSNRIAELTRRILAIKGFDGVEMHNDKTASNAYDFIIETVPSAEAFRTITRLVKPKGLIILKSRPFNSIELPITTIVQKEIRLIGAHYADFQEAINLVASGTLHIKDLLGATFTFEQAVPILLGTTPVAEDLKLFFKP
ncbi:MAG: alcohol dehydrogenase catalytic domain-containing protein [Legionella sp.]|jgi:threonine dehydrogenase-like Zn-dependent dehydrogenase